MNLGTTRKLISYINALSFNYTFTPINALSINDSAICERRDFSCDKLVSSVVVLNMNRCDSEASSEITWN